MQVEISAALNFIASNLYNKLPRRRVDSFLEEVEKGIAAKFQGHWYPDNPSKGAAYRCVNVSGSKVDPVIIYAAINSGLDIEEVNNYVPKSLTLWIDPGEVSYSIGEKGQIKLLYSDRRPIDHQDLQHIPINSNPTSISSPTAIGIPSPVTDFNPNLSATFGNLSLSGSSSSSSTSSWGPSNSPIPWSSPNACNANKHNPWSPSTTCKGWSGSILSTLSQPNYMPQRNNTSKLMTAAMFAQTKFGSTKLKTNGKKATHSRLSPTDQFNRAIVPPQSLFTAMQSSNNRMPGSSNNHFLHLMSDHNTPNSYNDMPAVFQGQMTPNNSFSHIVGGHMLNSPVNSPMNEHNGWVDMTDIQVLPGSKLLAT